MFDTASIGMFGSWLRSTARSSGSSSMRSTNLRPSLSAFAAWLTVASISLHGGMPMRIQDRQHRGGHRTLHGRPTGACHGAGVVRDRRLRRRGREGDQGGFAVPARAARVDGQGEAGKRPRPTPYWRSAAISSAWRPCTSRDIGRGRWPTSSESW